MYNPCISGSTRPCSIIGGGSRETAVLFCGAVTTLAGTDNAPCPTSGAAAGPNCDVLVPYWCPSFVTARVALVDSAGQTVGGVSADAAATNTSTLTIPHYWSRCTSPIFNIVTALKTSSCGSCPRPGPQATPMKATAEKLKAVS